MIGLLQAILFERPLVQGIILFFVVLSCLMVWRRYQTDRAKRVFLGSLMTAAILITLQAVITTDREAIRHTIDTLTDAVDRADTDTVVGMIDAEFQANGWTAEQASHEITRALKRIQVDDPFIQRLVIATNGDRGTAELTVYCRVTSTDIPFDTVVSSWRLTLRRRAVGWLLDGAQPVKINAQPIGSLNELLRY